MEISVTAFHEKMFKKIIGEGPRIVTDRPSSSLKDIAKREVCGFAGSALSAMIKTYKKLLIKHENENNWDRENYSEEELIELKKTSHNHQVYNYLMEIRYQHHDAIKDEDYMKFCYSTYDQFNNDGGLTLISPLYYNFFHNLLITIRKASEKFTFIDDRNEWILSIREDLQTNTNLEDAFCNHETNISLSLEFRKKYTISYGR